MSEQAQPVRVNALEGVDLSVLVCRGCCCGSFEGPDHEGHLNSLRVAVDGAGGRLRVTGCLGPCDRKNVVVVRTRGERRWTSRFYAAIDDVEVEALVGWFADQAIGSEPAMLADRRFAWPLPREVPVTITGSDSSER